MERDGLWNDEADLKQRAEAVTRDPGLDEEAQFQREWKECLRQAGLVLNQSTDDISTRQACNHPCLQVLVICHSLEQRYLNPRRAQIATSESVKKSVAAATSEPSYLQTIRKVAELASDLVFSPLLTQFDVDCEEPGSSSRRSAAQSHLATRPEHHAQTRPLTSNETDSDTRHAQKDRKFQPADVLAFHELFTVLETIRILLPPALPLSSATDSPVPPIAIDSNVARILLQVCGRDIFETVFRLSRPAPGQPEWKFEHAQAFSRNLLASIATESALSILFRVGRPRSQDQSARSASMAAARQSADRDSPRAPNYVLKMARRMSAVQLLRPDGVKALMRFSAEDDELAPNLAQLDSSRAVLILARILSDEPVGIPSDVWIEAILPQVTAFVADMASQPSQSDAASVQARALVSAIARFARKSPAWTEHVLLHGPIYSSFLGRHAASADPDISGRTGRPPDVGEGKGALDLDGTDVIISPLRIKEAADVLLFIFEHAEPSTDFFHFLLRPVLAPCLSLLDHLSRQITSTGRLSNVSPKGKRRADADGGRESLRGAIRTCLSAWIRLAPAKEIANELGPTGEEALLERLATGRIFAIDSRRRKPDSSASTEEPTSETERRHALSDSLDDKHGNRLLVLEDPNSPYPSFRWTSDESGTSLSRKSPSDPLSAILEQLPDGMKAQVHLTESMKASASLPPSTLGALSLPDIQPSTVTMLLKECGRIDVAKLILQAVLDQYVAVRAQQTLRSDEPEINVRPIIYLQFILQLFDTFGEALLKDDVHSIFAFVDFVLSQWSKQPQLSGTQDYDAAQLKPPEGGLSGLLNISDPSSRSSGDMKRSPDEDEDSSGELTTALNLLLALLEGDPRLSAQTNPMLAVIQARLPPLLSANDEEVRRVVQEAMLVLQARKASEQSTSGRKGGKEKQDSATRQTPREKGRALYQEALKLLQDPILPVRAHGLVILRELVSEPEPSHKIGSERQRVKPTGKSLISDLSEPSQQRVQELDEEEEEYQTRPEVEPALLPAILDIFVQAIQDEESYLYLNAVQGLAAMAITGGKAVLKVLVSKYVNDDPRRTGLSIPDQAEVDRRLRIGEALLSVIQRCGVRLGPDVSLVVEPLLTMLRKADEPVALRTSAVSLLGTCIEAAPMAMQACGFTTALVPICLDIISLESIDRTVHSVRKLERAQRRAKRKERISMRSSSGALLDVDMDDDEEEEGEEVQQKADDALAKDAKLPQLRRSALFLLSLLLSGTNKVLGMHLTDGEKGGRGGDMISLPTPIGTEQDGGGHDSDSLRTLRLPGGSFLAPLPTSSASAGTTAMSERRSAPPLMFDPKQLERTKVVLRYVKQKDLDAVVRVQAGEAEQMCLDLEVRLVQVAAVQS